MYKDPSLNAVTPTISFSTEDVVVDEDDGSAEVCLELSIPLSTNLEVVVTSAAGTGVLSKSNS